MTREEVDRLMQRRDRSWADRDADSLALDHAEDSVVESPAHGRVAGRAAIRAAYATWFDAFPDVRLTRDDLLVDSDRVAVFFTITGTHMKPFASIPATGRRMEIHGVSVMTLRDGLIVREKRWYDSTSLLLQIGVLKAKPM